MFEFSTANKIIFGEGTAEQLPDLVRGYGNRLLIVTGRTPQRFSELFERIASKGIDSVSIPIHREPSLGDIESALQVAREHQAQVVLGIGGGSALDAAKAVAALLGNPGSVLDYLEVIGLGRSLESPGVPCIAVPTTAGTGAEVTRNAVIDVPAHAVKVSLRSEYLLPKIALLDPLLARSVPPQITADTGFDALAQVMEPYVSNRANPMTDALALAGMALAARSLRNAYFNGNDVQARSDMALVSLWGGMCLANARLGAVHGLAAPIGGLTHAAHGAVCAALLTSVMRVNVAVARRHPAGSIVLERYRAVAQALTDDVSASIEQGIGWLEQLTTELGVKSLSKLGLATNQLDTIADRGLRASSMQGNPLPLERTDLLEILNLCT
ncbi:MAG TPA: iron-containing alcohol dehydrogenase [Polyangiaceae bacterium]